MTVLCTARSKFTDDGRCSNAAVDGLDGTGPNVDHPVCAYHQEADARGARLAQEVEDRRARAFNERQRKF